MTGGRAFRSPGEEPEDRVVAQLVPGTMHDLRGRARHEAVRAAGLPEQQGTLTDGNRAKPRADLLVAGRRVFRPGHRQGNLLEDLVDGISRSGAGGDHPCQPTPVLVDEGGDVVADRTMASNGTRIWHATDIIAAAVAPRKILGKFLKGL